ncbi:MAG TPA: endolytic transglycosylase MltG [Candidatus Limnocylindrales bacterium]|nr:endolytic transglycosylase MltG [Candidatus Limnocylindrales bacterium]
MTVRSGRGPREPEMPSWRASDGRGNPPVYPRRRNGNDGRGFRLPGILKFLIFAGVLGGIVLIALLTVFRPLARAGIVDWAWNNPGAITQFGFVGEMVREDLGTAVTAPAGTDATESVFTVEAGDTVFTIAPRLVQGRYVASERAFLYSALTSNLKLSAGNFLLRGNMKPSEVADALVRARVVITTLDLTFREGLRIEQMTALLQTKESGVDPQAFYDLATHPPAELLDDFEWLKAILPEGASLEGFLYPDTYQIVTSSNGGNVAVTDAEALVRLLLNRFHEVVGDDRMKVPKSRGLDFYQVVTLASIVEHEAILDEERALIAGAYQNRLDGLRGTARILNADPTVTYAKDTMELAKLPFEQWKDYFFWKVPPSPLADFRVDKALRGYQTYQVGGLIPGPISTPSLKSIDAALEPDQEDGYLYFVAIPDTKEHAFAKTLSQHNANLRKYGYL